MVVAIPPGRAALAEQAVSDRTAARCRSLPEAAASGHLGLHRLVDLAGQRAAPAALLGRRAPPSRPGVRSPPSCCRESGLRLAGALPPRGARRARGGGRPRAPARSVPRRGRGRRHDARGRQGGRGRGVRRARGVGGPARRGLRGARRGGDRRRLAGSRVVDRPGRRLGQRQARLPFACVSIAVAAARAWATSGRLRGRAGPRARLVGRARRGRLLRRRRLAPLEPGPLEILGLETARPARVVAAAEALRRSRPGGCGRSARWRRRCAWWRPDASTRWSRCAPSARSTWRRAADRDGGGRSGGAAGRGRARPGDALDMPSRARCPDWRTSSRRACFEWLTRPAGGHWCRRGHG